jgi:hypothetical protein
MDPHHNGYQQKNTWKGIAHHEPTQDFARKGYGMK